MTLVSSLDRASDHARQLGSGIDPATVPNYLLNVDHPLVVPAGVKVRVLITAQDVIHSWWVPALAIKKDAIPGFVNETWFDIDADKVGLYRGQCAELCGRDHGFMPIVVDVRSKADFATWLKATAAEQRQAAAAPAAPAQLKRPAVNRSELLARNGCLTVIRQPEPPVKPAPGQPGSVSSYVPDVPEVFVAVLDDGQILRFVQAFQQVAPLSTGELWAIPTMLRLGLVENLRRLAGQMIAARDERERAADWVRHGGGRVESLPADPSDVFLVAWHQAVRDLGETSQTTPGEWLARHEVGDLTEVLRREHRRQAANQVIEPP